MPREKPEHERKGIDVKTSSSRWLSVVVSGVHLTGFAGGDDVVTAKYREDRASHVVGMDGGLALALSSDRTGEIAIKLMQTSPSNYYLLNLAHRQGASRFTGALTDEALPISVLVTDTYRQDSAKGSQCYIKQVPDVARGANVNVQEWVFVARRLEFSLGAA
jgi:hypothetical protein